jgi:D-amino peptidase
MKVFISADIEGIAYTVTHDEGRPGNAAYPMACEEMTRETLAAVAGAKKAGADEILIKDAHGSGMNIDPRQIPSGVSLERSWSGHPYLMVEGIDPSFDAALFVGYHSAAGGPGNPLSHTVSGQPAWIKLNGRYCSEFMLYSYACAEEKVPTVFLAGDKKLIEDDGGLHPALVTVAAKEGIGSMARIYSPADVEQRIREGVERALKTDLSRALIVPPKHYSCEIFFKEQWHAEKVKYFPGCKKIENHTIAFECDRIYDVLNTIWWIIK